MKSFLRWAGSKLQLLPEIAPYWNDKFTTYVEPFCGSASLFFSLRPRNAVLSDLNSELVEALFQIQVSADSVSACLRRYRKDEATYYRIRKLRPSTMSPTERAARFIYLNGLCFNGLFRTNRDGAFNVPYGSKHRTDLFEPSGLRAASYALKAATIRCSDFQDVVDSTGQGDFIYLDPPYATSSKRTFVEYGEAVFGQDDLDRLITSLKRAEKRGVKFVLSYADVPEVRQLPARWSRRRVLARRNIAGFLDSRRVVREVLISNVRH